MLQISASLDLKFGQSFLLLQIWGKCCYKLRDVSYYQFGQLLFCTGAGIVN